MATPIRLLMVEDLPGDAELIVAELERAGFCPDWQRVDSEGEYLALLTPAIDVVICDYRLPSFSAVRALALMRESTLDIPFIVVSGAIGEALAVECMKHGAIDYLFKDRLGRLGSSVRQALEQKSLRQANLAAEAALRDSEERYRLITQTIRDGIFMLDLDGGLLFANPAAERLAGYSLEEFRGRSIFSLLAPAGARLAAARLGASRQGEEVSPWFESELTRKDGARIWVEAQVANVKRDGQVVGRLGVVRDITARRTAEETMKLLGSAVWQTGEAVVITTSDLERPGPKIVYVNPAFTTMTGYTAEEAIGKTPRMLQGPSTDLAALRRLREDLEAGRNAEAELVNRRKDGTPFHVSLHIAPVRDEHGGISHFVGLHRDVSEAKQLEAQVTSQREALYQREKVSGMGQLLAGVAHELNNPLTVVSGQAHLLFKALGEGPLRERVEKLRAGVDRSTRIVKNFLALARQRPTQWQSIDCNQIVRDVVDLLAYSLRVDDVQVSLDLARETVQLWGDADQVQQLLVNLVTNAQHALRSTPEPRRLTLGTRVSADRARVAIEVADNGPGIPPEIQSRIFEPFYTTKPEGQGTGLGLSLCLGIAETHGGTIRLEPRSDGSGAVFVVELAVGTPPVQPELEDESTPAPPARATVLVVDDEPEVAEVLAALIQLDDHRVDIAGDGHEALARMAERDYDVILTDLRMPHLDGPGLYREVGRRRPELLPRFVFFTGDTLGSETRAFLESVTAPCVMKPFEVDAVRRAIRRVRALANAGTGD